MFFKSIAAALFCGLMFCGCYVKKVEKKETLEPQRETVIHDRSGPDVVINESEPFRRKSTTITNY